MSLHHLTACPGCMSTEPPRRLFSMPMEHDTCQVVRCVNCTLVFKDLIPSSEGMTDIYTDGYVHFQPESIDPRDVHSARDKLLRVTELLTPARRTRPLRIVDFGCGRGGFVKIARSLGHEAFGVDPFMPGAIESEWLRRGTPQDLEPGQYDVVIMLNVAEHLPEPRGTFAEIRRALAPGGVLLLTCPYGGSVARRVYRAAWSHMSYDEHILFWTPRALTTMLRTLGFAGRVQHRVLGAPFPYGRVPTAQGTTKSTVSSARAAAPTAVPPQARRWQQIQSQVWRVARTIQRSPGLTNAVRLAVNTSRLGDYLELTIATG